MTEPRGHGALLAGLWRSAADARLPHALLFRGAGGIGKFLAARWLTWGLVCEKGPGPPCGTCGPCVRARTGNHPDLFEIDTRAEGRDAITIFHVAHRDLRPKDAYDGPAIEDFLFLRAHEGGWRTIVVREAERMNEAAQNALLKTLEEPGKDALLVLESSRPEMLLATVRSRLVPVLLERLSEGDTRAVLAACGLGDDLLERLLRWCRGAPGRALELASQAGLAMRELVLEVLAAERTADDAAAALWALEGEFPGRTAPAQRRARARALLDVGLEVLLDRERFLAGAPPAGLSHGEQVAHLPPRAALERERCVEAWLLARQDVALNLVPEALVDRAFCAAAPRGVVPRIAAEVRRV